jgi:hypothetical protein
LKENLSNNATKLFENLQFFAQCVTGENSY